MVMIILYVNFTNHSHHIPYIPHCGVPNLLLSAGIKLSLLSAIYH